jgi:hypothetical protein
MAGAMSSSRSESHAKRTGEYDLEVLAQLLLPVPHRIEVPSDARVRHEKP